MAFDRLRFFVAAVSVALFSASTLMAQENDAILVFGGTSGTGLETIKVLRSQDIPVTVFVRPTSDLSSLEPLGVSTVTGDAMNQADVENAFASGTFRAAISSLGGRRGEDRPDYIGNKYITDAAAAAGVTRVIQVSSIGAGDSAREEPTGDNFMARVLYEKTRGEDHLIASGLDFTIIRPGGLRDGPVTGKGELQAPDAPGGMINRSELALLIVNSLDDDGAIGQIYNAVDPSMGPPPEGFE